MDAVHTELYDLVMNAMSQQQLAMVAYYCDMKNTELEETYSYMMDYQTAVIAKFYTLSRPFYDSCYRDFYYYGMTEEEIDELIEDVYEDVYDDMEAVEERLDELLETVEVWVSRLAFPFLKWGKLIPLQSQKRLLSLQKIRVTIMCLLIPQAVCILIPSL